MTPHYLNLVKAFCKLAGVAEADVDALAQGGPIEINGVGFTFGHNEVNAPDRMLVFCDYGPVPEGAQAKSYRALLETNLFLFESDTAVFSIMPESGRALCAVRFMLEPLRADELRAILVFLAQRALDWRRTHFDVGIPAADTAAAHGNPMAASLRGRLKRSP